MCRSLARDASGVRASIGEISRGLRLLLVIVLGKFIQAGWGMAGLPVVLCGRWLRTGIRVLRARNVVLGRLRVLGLLRLRSLLLLRRSCLWRRLCGRWLWFLRSGQGNREGAGAPEMPGQGLGDCLLYTSDAADEQCMV